MKAPKLLKNESAASFKARVKSWEKATGKKYPTTFSGKTNEERVLAGETRLTGLGIKPKDYTSEYSDEIKEFELGNIKQPNKKDQDEQAIADIKSGKVDPYTMDLPGKNQLVINKRLAEIDAADKKRLDDVRKAENQEIRDEVALDKEVNPWGIDNIRRATGMEVGRSDTQFTKGGGYNLTIPKNIPSDKQDQSGMGTDVKPIGAYNPDTDNKSNRFSLKAGYSERQIESQLRRYKFKKTKASDALKIKRLENLLAKKRIGG